MSVVSYPQNTAGSPVSPSGMNSVRTAGTLSALVQTALPVGLHYLSGAELDALRSAARGRILGEVHFVQQAPPAAVATDGHPLIGIDMPLCGPALIEVWTSAEPVAVGRDGSIAYTHNSEVLFGYVADPVVPGSALFEDVVRRRYREILAFVEARGYPYLLRVWNYFPDINREYEGLENYRRFSRGRYQAFEEHFGAFTHRLPAASAVGTCRGDLHVYFIASRTPGTYRENPRQVSAYHYPPQYGPRSPSFARATFKRWEGAEVLFISGTASIVGHESCHHGDVMAQLEESLRNVSALIETTGRDESAGLHGLAEVTALKVYLRDPQSCPVVSARLERALGRAVPTLYLQAELCRQDLLVEVEGLALGR